MQSSRNQVETEADVLRGVKAKGSGAGYECKFRRHGDIGVAQAVRQTAVAQMQSCNMTDVKQSSRTSVCSKVTFEVLAWSAGGTEACAGTDFTAVRGCPRFFGGSFWTSSTFSLQKPVLIIQS